jgi:Saccharopine dehydrogenase NADP binding domain
MTDFRIAVYGPTGYTGRQVLAELRTHGITRTLVGRDRERLQALAEGDDIRVARLADADGLRRAFDGAGAVINCVGPFELSAGAVARAAVSVGANYLDFTAEQGPVIALLERWDEPARQAGVAVVPAGGFYGGLGDLLAAMTSRGIAEPVEVTVAYAVQNWLLTAGSRATAPYMAGRRWVWRDGRLELVTGEPRYGSFAYPGPLGEQPVMEDYPLPEAVTVPRHVRVPKVRLVMTASTLREIFSPDAPAPEQVAEHERADSRFTVLATVSDGEVERRTTVRGRDIYGVTAPMIVAAARALSAEPRAGVLAVSQVVSPTDVLAQLEHTHGLTVEREVAADPVR